MSTTMTNPVATRVYAIDGAHSQVGFAIKHMMISKVKGNFTEFGGTITLGEENLADSRVEVVITTGSIDTRDAKRDEHLRSADFFDVATYPEMRFVSTAVVPQRGERFVLVGDLTIAGVTREVEIAAEKTGSGVSPWGTQVVAFEGETTINRKDFGLTWNVALEAGGLLVAEEVKIHLELEAVLQ